MGSLKGSLRELSFSDLFMELGVLPVPSDYKRLLCVYFSYCATGLAHFICMHYHYASII